MDHPASSSPRRDDAALQDKDIERIASQMEWDNEADVGVQSGDEMSVVGVESGTRTALSSGLDPACTTSDSQNKRKQGQ